MALRIQFLQAKGLKWLVIAYKRHQQNTSTHTLFLTHNNVTIRPFLISYKTVCAIAHHVSIALTEEPKG